MYISQFFILSPRGERLVFKDYRQDAPRNADEIFFRTAKFWDGTHHRQHKHQAPEGDCPPFFTEKGVNFCCVQRGGLFFVCTTMRNTSPSFTVEILLRIVKVIRDFVGCISEELIRKNFTLIYELLDEMLDVGVPQHLSTERLRPLVFNKVIPSSLDEPSSIEVFIDKLRHGEFAERSRRSNATTTSVMQASIEQKNEIYVDFLERLNVVFNNVGQVLLFTVDGSIVMKSFLAGSPILHLALNDDLVVGSSGAAKAQQHEVILDSVNFHQDVDYSNFETAKRLSIRPPEGEFTLMTYTWRGGTATPPFYVVQSTELESDFHMETTIRVRASISADLTALSVTVTVPAPMSCAGASVSLSTDAVGQQYEYKTREKVVVWSIEKFIGGTEKVCKIRFTTSTVSTAATRREVGPISMNFEIPRYTLTGLCARMLNLEERSSAYNPDRWIRNLVLANSYVFRTH
uniref:Putative adaptor complex AP-4 medium subunit n=1 Tax=Trypanosoma vivax (strain Y486) TaxID=1055687 RepID=G0TZM0_TRYVY|nr:putative adaptor complex AP-4 medium subunit [Trypanosoma vivax Y486]